MRHLWRRVAGATLFSVLVGLIGVLPVSAADTNPVPSTPLPAGTVHNAVPAHGFVYYTFTFPSNETNFTITLNVPAATTAFDQAVGFNVYLPDGAKLAPQVPTPQDRILQIATPPASTALLQVYNYADVAFNYSLTQTGILPPPAPMAPVALSAVPLRPEALNPFTALPLPQPSTCDLLPGDTLYYLFRVIQAGSYGVHFSTQPGNRDAVPNFGLRIVDASGKEVARSAVQGVNYGQQELSAYLAAGDWYVELYNTSTLNTLSCSVSLSGPGITPGATE